VKLDPKLREFATVRQLEYVEAIEQHGSLSAAARALGVARGSMQDSLRHLKKRAAQRDGTLHRSQTVPDGYTIKGSSTYFDKDGNPAGQWLKTTVDTQRQAELMRAAVAALSKDVAGMAPIVAAPATTNADLLAVYPLGDPHFGMYAWAKETGDDFDLKTARRLTMGAVDRLVSSAPAAETAIILPLGDIFHANDQTNQTPAHKHQLDVDSRFVHVLQVGIETFRHCILRALEKHSRVVCRFVSGNHDPQAVWALAFTIAAYFDKEPRVEVDLSPSAHWFYRFGKVLIGATHGDKSKAEQLLGVMACDRAEDWGQTRHRYWYCGHVHHSSVKEFPGVTVETFRTLAASDAYAAGHGYRAGRDMRAIILHREHGEVERHRCDIGML
jgi:UDP-2,3-diacylglucosamine pyrophosphatase LpxH